MSAKAILRKYPKKQRRNSLEDEAQEDKPRRKVKTRTQINEVSLDEEQQESLVEPTQTRPKKQRIRRNEEN